MASRCQNHAVPHDNRNVLLLNLQVSSMAVSSLWPFASDFGFRNGRRFCLGASTGNRRSPPQVRHLLTRTSAHGFLPPLLWFSISSVQLFPSMRKVSQYLQMVCFKAGDRRIWLLSEIARAFVSRRRERACLAILFDSLLSSSCL